MKQKQLLVTFALGLTALSNVCAQEADFDLSSQRSEVQLVNPVPGKKIDHHGLIINPTPHFISILGDDKVDILKPMKVVVDKRKGLLDYQKELSFLPLVTARATEYKKALPIKVSIKAFTSADAISNVSGAYKLRITPTEINLVGYDDTGVYYGIQTLREILSNSSIAETHKLPCLEIKDAPVFPYRGVVEGFYGSPWSHEVRLSLIDFYGKYKMNTYIYGPKDDPYHSSPYWRLAYPEREQQNIKELVAACKRNRVDFVWAIHPGKDIKWNEEDYRNLVHKFDLMYADGVRSFAIFFDDIEGEGTNPNRQVELLNRLTREFVKAKGDVSPLIICPTDYSKLWAKPGENGPLSIYGKTLDPSVRVFWTGDVVCSDVTKSTLDWVNSRIKRPAFFWWNYAVTDYVRNIVLQGPVYGLDTTLTEKDMCGLVSNPMEHGEASKLSLYSVADYTWNPKKYNALDSWERGLEVMMPQAKEAYRTFAIHSADTETGYRRDESWETETFRLADYTTDKRDKLYKTFDAVEKAPHQIEEKCTDLLLLGELRPWLKEFSKLGKRGKAALRLMDLYRSGDASLFWTTYLNEKMTPEDRKAYEAHKSGTMKLQPFYDQAMRDLADAFYQQQSGKKAFRLKAIGTYPNLSTTQANLMLDGNDSTFYTSGVSQKAGDWIGVALPEAMNLKSVRIKQGRNSKDDSDYFDHVTLESSIDGKTWKPLVDAVKNMYEISADCQEAGQVRYLRLRRLDSQRSNWASIRSFTVTPLFNDNLAISEQTNSNDQKESIQSAFDRQLDTSVKMSGKKSFDIGKGIAAYTFYLSIPQNNKIIVRQYNKKNKVKEEKVTSDNLFIVKVLKGCTRIEIEGNAELFEIIPHTIDTPMK